MNGKRRAQVTEFLRTLPYRLLATLRQRPTTTLNSDVSEALRRHGQIDMLNRFFKNDQNTSDTRMTLRRAPSQGALLVLGGGLKDTPRNLLEVGVLLARAARRPSDVGLYSDLRLSCAIG